MLRLFLLKGKYFKKPVDHVPDSYLKWIKNNFKQGSYGHKIACELLDIRKFTNLEARLQYNKTAPNMEVSAPKKEVSAPKKEVDPKVTNLLREIEDLRRKKAREEMKALKQKQKDFEAEKQKLDYEWVKFVEKYRPPQSYTKEKWMKDREKIALLEKKTKVSDH